MTGHFSPPLCSDKSHCRFASEAINVNYHTTTAGKNQFNKYFCFLSKYKFLHLISRCDRQRWLINITTKTTSSRNKTKKELWDLILLNNICTDGGKTMVFNVLRIYTTALPLTLWCQGRQCMLVSSGHGGQCKNRVKSKNARSSRAGFIYGMRWPLCKHFRT